MWWLDWDDFIHNLTTALSGHSGLIGGADVANAGAKRRAEYGRKKLSVIEEGNRPYSDSAGVTTPSPSPSAKPSPSATASKAPATQATPAASPIPSPVSAGGNFEQGLAGMTQTFLSEFMKLQGGKGGQGSKYDLRETSPVFMGGSKNPPRSERAERWPAQRVAEMGAAINDIYSWSDEKTLKFSELAQQAGYKISPTVNKAEVMNIWQQMVTVAAGSYAAGKKVSPWELMRRYAAGGDATGKIQSKTTTNTSYSVTSALTAEQLAHAALSERLGRNATPEEVQEFKNALNAAEKKNPTVTTTTTDTSGNSTSTTKEGLQVNAFTADWGMEHNKAEAAAYQTAGQLMPWFFEALGAGV